MPNRWTDKERDEAFLRKVTEAIESRFGAGAVSQSMATWVAGMALGRARAAAETLAAQRAREAAMAAINAQMDVIDGQLGGLLDTRPIEEG